MEHVALQGAEVPALGLGTWELSGAACRDAVETALDAGYRHIDTAQSYRNEQAVGEGIDAADVDREDVFLVTKVLPTDAGAEAFEAAVERSLDRLQTSYVDLALLHWPSPLTSFQSTANGMAAVVDRGLARHVGVSNFRKRRLERARAVSPVPLLADQVQFHPYYTQRSLLNYCQQEDVLLTAYSPLARGEVLNDDALQTVGERYGKSAAQVALRWATQHRNVATIPRSSSRTHIEANIDIFDFKLDRTEIDRITQPSYLKTGLAWARSALDL
ncbi:MAG: aldo/keto reductase [Halobacteriaceae archaeon]